GRLKPDVTIEKARAELTLLNNQLQQTLPDTHKNFGVRITPLQGKTAANIRTALLILFAAVALVLLVGCANFVNLLMVRNASRQREIATRTAPGASRSRLLNQLLSESVLLAILGGAAGIVLANVGLRLLVSLLPSGLVALKDVGLNVTVLTFTVVVSILCGLGCGMLPSLQLRRIDVHTSLKDGSRTTSGGGTIRQILVVSEITLAIVPLIGSTLLLRSFHRLLE